MALFILINNVQKVTLQMNSSDDPSVTFNRTQLEKKLPHSFHTYKVNPKLWQKELVDGIVKSRDKRQTLYRHFR
ncbi:hypothetical protein [Bacillus sp. NPDC093026]|uniref:hypothetical protein n=1 Tax=Bacillus sp. NPDC093026 TaxID=3363948 RepID=UPI00381C737B